MAYSLPEGYSQATDRSYRIFKDQHGRQWGADIENKTQAPCGPLSSRFKSPLRIPQKYIVIANAQAGELVIAYEQWLKDLRDAHVRYMELVRAQKIRMSPAMPHTIEDDDPNLLLAVGVAPAPLQQVLAARDGNRWVLGIPHPDTGEPELKPEWAMKFFPEPVEIEEEHFPNYDDDDRAPMGEEPTETSHATVTGGDETVTEGVGQPDESWELP